MTPARGPNRRAKGDGSVYYDKTRDRWCGTLTVPQPGKPRARKTVTARTEQEAEQKLAALQAEHTPHTIYIPAALETAAVTKADSRGETLSDVVRPALEQYVEEGDRP